MRKHLDLGKLLRCEKCRDYTCIGYRKDDGTREWSCGDGDGDGGVSLNANNILPSSGTAVCSQCMRVRGNQTSVKRRAKHREKMQRVRTEQAGGRNPEQYAIDTTRAIYMLHDPLTRKKLAKKDSHRIFCGTTSVFWDAVLDADTGYGILKGRDNTVIDFYRRFRRRRGKEVKTVADFEYYKMQISCPHSLFRNSGARTFSI